MRSERMAPPAVLVRTSCLVHCCRVAVAAVAPAVVAAVVAAVAPAPAVAAAAAAARKGA